MRTSSSASLDFDIVPLIQDLNETPCEAPLIERMLEWLSMKCGTARAQFYQWHNGKLTHSIALNVDNAWLTLLHKPAAATNPLLSELGETSGFVDWENALAKASAYRTLAENLKLLPGLAYGCKSANTQGKSSVTLISLHDLPSPNAADVRYQLSSLTLMLHLVGAKPRPQAGILSVREMDILGWAKVGKTCWETAKILNISPSTVNYHFKSVYCKLSVSNRTQAVYQALSLGLIK